MCRRIHSCKTHSHTHTHMSHTPTSTVVFWGPWPPLLFAVGPVRSLGYCCLLEHPPWCSQLLLQEWAPQVSTTPYHCCVPHPIGTSTSTSYRRGLTDKARSAGRPAPPVRCGTHELRRVISPYRRALVSKTVEIQVATCMAIGHCEKL